MEMSISVLFTSHDSYKCQRELHCLSRLDIYTSELHRAASFLIVIHYVTS